MANDFNELIHEQRGEMLSILPKGARKVGSAGCAGRWYFDWFEAQYGPVEVHYGVELFSEEPDDLPPNVIWIRNSVADMHEIPSDSLDLLFSGQNIEHLYYTDLLGFLLECSRVVRTDGYLCIDSPNRLVTQELGYIQPQHVLELTRENITRFVENAGFEVVAVNGIWACMGQGHLYDDVTTITPDADRRIESAHDNPDEAFIWWLVAQKKRPCDVSKVQNAVDSVVARKFGPFVAARFQKVLGSVLEIEGTHTILKVDGSEHGCVFYGPYVPLREGRYAAEFLVKFLEDNGSVSVSVTSNLGQNVLASRVVQATEVGRWRSVELEFTVPYFIEGIETPLVTHGTSALLRFGSQILRQ